MTATNLCLRLSEYGSAREFADPHGRIAAALRAQSTVLKQSLGLPEEPFILTHAGDRSTIRARGIAGSLRVGGTWIDVIPQFATRDSGGWVDALLTIMHRASAKRAFAVPLGAIGGQRRADFVDHISRTFADHLTKAYGSGLIRTYNSYFDSGLAIRGRLLTTPSAIVGILRKPGTVYFEEAVLDERNDFNDLLLWAGNLLIGMTNKPSVRALLRLALKPLQRIAVAPRQPSRPLRSAPRQFGDYNIPLQIADDLLQGNIAGIKLPGVDGSALLVKTSSIYERFVERSVSIAAAKLELLSSRQASIQYGSPQGAYPALYTRPDVLVRRGDTPLLVIDAKYKSVDRSTQRTGTANDYYQVLASMIAHKVKHGLLLFPGRRSTSGPQSWTVLVGDERYTLYSANLDIDRVSTMDGLAALDNELIGFVRNIAIDALV